MTDLAFRNVDQVPRDRGGRWVHGPGGGAPAGAKPLPDAKFADITIAYRPRHPDGHADPGEVVWARVPFEDDPSQAKDRPVLIVGRTKDGKNLVGLQLTSKPGTGRDGRESIGVGDWDKSGRPSYLKYDRLIQVDDRNYRREGSYMKKAKFQDIANNLTKRNGAPTVQLAAETMETFDSAASKKAWEKRERAKAEAKAPKKKTVAADSVHAHGHLVPSKRESAPKEWFGSKKEQDEARAIADEKARNVPKPTPDKIAKNRAMLEAAKTKGRAGGEMRGNSYDRKKRGEALFEEFGGKKRGYVCCPNCGIKVSPGGRGGYASMEQDKILTAFEGGGYGTPKSFPNILPSCRGCNRSRNDAPWPVRPSWEKPKKPRASKKTGQLALVAAAGFVDGDVVQALPLGWEDEPGAPVIGILHRRTVDAWFGDYEQTIVGGEVVDPATIINPTNDFTLYGAVEFGFESVPRDKDGKWTKNGGGGGGGPVKPEGFDSWGPGKKAAWTKKNNPKKLPLGTASTAPSAPQFQLDSAVAFKDPATGKVTLGVVKDQSDVGVVIYNNVGSQLVGPEALTAITGDEVVTANLNGVERTGVIVDVGGGKVPGAVTVQFDKDTTMMLAGDDANISIVGTVDTKDKSLTPGSTVLYETKSGKIAQGTVVSGSTVTGADGKQHYIPTGGVKGVVKPQGSMPPVLSDAAPPLGKKSAKFTVDDTKPSNWSSLSPGQKAAWTKKHGGASKPSNSPTKSLIVPGEKTVVTYQSRSMAAQAAQQRMKKLKRDPSAMTGDEHDAWIKRTVNGLDTSANAAVLSYTGSGYGSMGNSIKAGQPNDKVIAMDRGFRQGGEPARKVLFRGQSNGSMKELDVDVGSEFTQPKFGSYTDSKLNKVASFASLNSSFTSGVPDKTLVVKIVDTHGIRALPGTDYERETIMPRGVRYRVTAIEDFVLDGDPSVQHRYIEVEVVPGQTPPSFIDGTGSAVAAFGLDMDSVLVDDDLADPAIAAISTAYREARALVRPRIEAALTSTLVAAGGDGRPILSDSEWDDLIARYVADALGDAGLDGVIGAAVATGTMPTDGHVEYATTIPADKLSAHAPVIREQINVWLDTNATLDTTQALTLFDADGPLADAAAKQVAETELHAAVNGGIFQGYLDAGVAAVQWVTQRDLRVRDTHRAALLQTRLPGQAFTIGGASARYPGDPMLPYAERVNCRCYLTHIDGDRAQRAVASTVKQLRVEAGALGVRGRARMRKAELQMAVVKALCLQGLAGGPECPDLLPDMNRAALLTLARQEGIVGRYRMNRATLLDAVTAALRGGTTAMTVDTVEFAGWDKVKRGKDGRWTDGTGVVVGFETTEGQTTRVEFISSQRANTAFQQHIRVTGDTKVDDQMEYTEMRLGDLADAHARTKVVDVARGEREKNDLNTLSSYTESGYTEINFAAKQAYQGKELHPFDQARVDSMDRLFAYGTNENVPLYRGKSRGSKLTELGLNPGDEFVDGGYGSWSTSTSIASGFARGTDGAVFMRVKNPGAVKSIPGNIEEAETIMPRNTRYKVDSVMDFAGVDDTTGETRVFRVMNVSVVAG